LLSQRINALRESLKAVGNGQPSKVKALLISNLSQAKEALNQTEADFTKAGSSGEKDDHARVFFDDLRLTYLTAEKQLNREYKAAINSQPRLSTVSLIDQPYNIPLSAEGTIRAMEENELAFNTIAATKSLTFDLKVITEPQKARIFFKRRGDPYTESGERSTTTLLYLTKAIWVIKAEKDGCHPKEREYDPFHEPIPSVELTMDCGK
jgi:hypothetical protein